MLNTKPSALNIEDLPRAVWYFLLEEEEITRKENLEGSGGAAIEMKSVTDERSAPLDSGPLEPSHLIWLLSDTTHYMVADSRFLQDIWQVPEMAVFLTMRNQWGESSGLAGFESKALIKYVKEGWKKAAAMYTTPSPPPSDGLAD